MTEPVTKQLTEPSPTTTLRRRHAARAEQAAREIHAHLRTLTSMDGPLTPGITETAETAWEWLVEAMAAVCLAVGRSPADVREKVSAAIQDHDEPDHEPDHEGADGSGDRDNAREVPW